MAERKRVRRVRKILRIYNMWARKNCLSSVTYCKTRVKNRKKKKELNKIVYLLITNSYGGDSFFFFFYTRVMLYREFVSRRSPILYGNLLIYNIIPRQWQIPITYTINTKNIFLAIVKSFRNEKKKKKKSTTFSDIIREHGRSEREKRIFR